VSQLFVSPARIQAAHFSLDALEAHHVLRVLRKKVGDTLICFDGKGRRFEGRLTIAETSSNRVEGDIVRWLEIEAPSARLILVQGLPRGPKWDYVIEKATELGVDAILPFLGETSPIELDPSAAEAKLVRWNRLAQSAAKQCDRASIPLIHTARPLYDLESFLQEGLLLVCSTEKHAAPIKTIVKPEQPGPIFIVIGPESGFSANELTWLHQRKGHFITLGKSTLRTETAGLVALTLVRHLLGEM
jgi:16S rRNA (uracil1498-N3)-methyltransferase